MPKKTKKEKIIAEYRRKLKFIQNQKITISPVIEPSAVKKQEEIHPKIITNTKPAYIKEDSLITSYFKRDFKKSLILIVFIIGLEIFLYFATIKQYLRLF